MAEIAIAVALAVVEGVIVHLVNKKIDEIVVPVDLKEAKTCLGKMQEILSDSEKMIDAGGPILPCYYVKQVQDVAYEIEDALDEFMFDVLEHENSHALSKIIPQKLIKSKPRSKLSSKMNDITKKINAQNLQEPHGQPTPSSSGCGGDRIWSNQDLAEGDELVGFEVLEEQLFTELRQRDQSPLVILIAGPGGSGKSTLANKVYRSHEVEGRASCVRDWVELPKISQEEAERRCLQVQGQERCLVVLDDAWIKQDLKLIVKALPNGRIIITSRNSGVASLLYPKYIHDLSRGLSWEKAKELFCKKAFDDGQGDWPSELADWAKKILKRCEGMPLAISAIGTFLYNKKIPVDWKTLHDSLRSELCTEGSDLFIISRNLQASYRDLPNHLRSCFLYFSMFPDEEEEEYYSISRERLIRLWAAEKFVQPETGKTIEQAAEGYLNDLVERNLVVATKREYEGGRVRSCRVLNLVREINISRRKGFITVWEPDDYLSAEKIRRLSAHNGGIKKIKSKIHSVRTLLAFGQAISDLEVVLKTAKYLKVLDLEGTSGLKEFPEAVKRLILLTYLSLRKTDVERIPKSIKKNVLLETLDLKSTKVTELPEEIYQLKKLRHLLVDIYNVALHGFEGVEISKGVGDLSGSIHKLSLIKAKNTEIIKALGELKDLRKLGLVDLDTEDGKELCIALEQMKYLSTLDVRAKDQKSLDLDQCQSPPLFLRHLYLRGSLQELPTWISKLTSLQKVGLHGSNLNANPLEVLEALPHLIELNLVGYYGGEKLVFRADKFKTLMTLSLKQFDQLKSLEVKDGALPVLMELTISRCPNLQSLPEGIGGLIELNLVGCYRGEELVFKADQFKKLRTLIIDQFDQLKSLEVKDGALPVLMELTISRCPNLQSLPEGIGGLIELNLVGCYRGEELVFKADQFKKLRTLIIDQFDQLTSFQVEDGALPVLRELNISHCPNLKSLPKGIGGIKSLYKLFLQNMPDELIATLQKDSPHSDMVAHSSHPFLQRWHWITRSF